MDNQTLINNILPIFVAVLFSFTAGGVTVAALLAVVLRMVLKSPVILSFLEKLYSGLAPEWKETLRDAVQLGAEVTDDVPAGSKAQTVVYGGASGTVAYTGTSGTVVGDSAS